MGLSRRTWFLIFVAISALATLNTLHFYLDDVARNHYGTLPRRVIEEFTGAYASLVLIPMVLWFSRRFCWRDNWVEFLGGHALGAILYSVLHTTIMWVSRTAVFAVLGLGVYDFGNMRFRYPMEAAGDVLDYTLLLMLITLFETMAKARRAAVAEAELETKLAEAKLENLRLQLQPHFLFNTLNAISSVMYEDVTKADKMLAQVSDFMRLVLESGGVQTVALSEELRIERMYVDIMKTRLERNLALEVRVDDEAQAAMVPFMVLQPLLENSIRHGMGSARSSLDLGIDIERSNGSTLIRVRDNGIGYSPDTSWGIGLTNIASRLSYLYGDRASFNIERGAAGGTVATLVLPFSQVGEA